MNRFIDGHSVNRFVDDGWSDERQMEKREWMEVGLKVNRCEMDSLTDGWVIRWRRSDR